MINTPRKLSNKSIVDKVNQWQEFKYIKPLTCRNCDEKVYPKESHSKVILICPKCGAVQDYVPRVVLETNLSFPPVLKSNMARHIQALLKVFDKEEKDK